MDLGGCILLAVGCRVNHFEVLVQVLASSLRVREANQVMQLGERFSSWSMVALELAPTLPRQSPLRERSLGVTGFSSRYEITETGLDRSNVKRHSLDPLTEFLCHFEGYLDAWDSEKWWIARNGQELLKDDKNSPRTAS